MPRWFVPRNALSAPQRAAVELSCERHRVLTGPPGSGKSLVLLHRARWLVDRYGIVPGALRIFCYTNALKSYLRSACGLVGLPEETVDTFHNWCRRQYEAAHPDRPPFGAFRGGSMFRDMVDDVRDATRAGFVPEPLQAALVDEGQDLGAAAYEILRRAARHVTVALDYKQQIFDEGAGIDQITRTLGVRARDVALLEAYRSTPRLMELASRFVDDEAERARLLAQSRTADPKGAETPLLYRAWDGRDEKRELARVLAARLALGEHVGILLPTRRLVDEFAEELRGRGLGVEVPPARSGEGAGAPNAKADAFPVHDFSGTAPKVMAYPSTKGLTFDSVLLPHLCRGAFPWYSAERLRKTLFVAVTRARGWAYLGTILGREAGVLGEVDLRNGRSFLTVRQARGLELFEEYVQGEVDERIPPPRIVRKDEIDELL